MRYLVFLSILLFSAFSTADTMRLVSIDGALTEIIYQLQAEESLVAVDSTSLHPQAATQLANVGYMRALSAEGVLSVNPSDVITTQAAGPEKVLQQLTAAGIKVHIIDEPYTAQGVINKVKAVGQIVNKPEQTKQLAANIEQKLALIEQQLAKKEAPLSALLFLGMQGNQLMAAGANTQADALLQAAHLINANADVQGYKPLSKEAVLSLNPDVIIIANTEGSLDAHISKQFAYSKAFANNKVLLANAEDLLGFGPRFADALARITAVAYP